MTDTASHDSGRLDVLEMRIAHQDQVIEDLSQTVAEQWTAIDRLTREVEALRDHAAASDAAARPASGDEPPPPHW